MLSPTLFGPTRKRGPVFVGSRQRRFALANGNLNIGEHETAQRTAGLHTQRNTAAYAHKQTRDKIASDQMGGRIDDPNFSSLQCARAVRRQIHRSNDQ